MAKRKKITTNCAQCKQIFTHRKDHPNKYCSRACAGKARRHKVKCQVCGERVKKSRNIFCSYKCRGLDSTARTVTTILCDGCGALHSRHQSHFRKNNFCSKECRYIWQSKFRSGKNHPLFVPVGTERHRVDARYRARAWVKVAEPNIWRQRARVAFESQGYYIPYGKIIHHKDGDTLNDNVDNLECVTRKWHINHHRKELMAGKLRA